jgi:hypothetical protein
MHPKAVETLPDLSEQLARIELPPQEPITPEVLERRRAMFERSMRLREKMRPIDIPVEDLIDMDFYGDEDEA